MPTKTRKSTKSAASTKSKRINISSNLIDAVLRGIETGLIKAKNPSEYVSGLIEREAQRSGVVVTNGKASVGGASM